MYKWWIKIAIYFISFILSLVGLDAIDFNRFIKKGKIVSSWALYLVLAFALAYLLGEFFINIIYILN